MNQSQISYWTQKGKVESMIEEYHDPTLLKPNESPNGNTQYLIFNDGESVYTKGGHAFLRRTLFPTTSTIYGLLKTTFKFPNTYGKYTYAMVPSTQICKEIHTEMKKLRDIYTSLSADDRSQCI